MFSERVKQYPVLSNLIFYILKSYKYNQTRLPKNH